MLIVINSLLLTCLDLHETNKTPCKLIKDVIQTRYLINQLHLIYYTFSSIKALNWVCKSCIYACFDLSFCCIYREIQTNGLNDLKRKTLDTINRIYG